MDDDKLGQLRQDVLGELLPMTVGDNPDIEPERRVELLIMAVQAGYTEAVVGLRQAFEVAHTIEDQDIKIEALSSIIREIDSRTEYVSEKSSNTEN